MGGLGSRCCRQQCASGNEDFWRINSILSLLSCPSTHSIRCQAGHLKSQKEKIMLKVKWCYKRFFLFWYPCGGRFKCWSCATALMSWDSWHKSSVAHVKFPCVSFAWAMYMSHKLASFWLLNLEEILDWQDRGLVRQSGGSEFCALLVTNVFYYVFLAVVCPILCSSFQANETEVR